MHLIKEFINKNIIVFIVAVSVFAVGIVMGSLYAVNIGASDADELKQLLNQYITLDAADKITFWDIVQCECTNHLKFVPLILICAMDYRLIIPCGIALAFRGYQLGFSVSFICSNFGKTGILITTASAVFSYFFTVPVYLFLFVIMVDYATGRKNNINTREKAKTFELVILFVIAYAVLFCAACIEGVLLPIFIDFLN